MGNEVNINSKTVTMFEKFKPSYPVVYFTVLNVLLNTIYDFGSKFRNGLTFFRAVSWKHLGVQ